MITAHLNKLFKAINLLIIYPKLRYTNLTEVKASQYLMELITVFGNLLRENFLNVTKTSRKICICTQIISDTLRLDQVYHKL